MRHIIWTLEEALEKIGIDYYLIGALARDAWFQQEKIVSRTTADVDFAILVPQKEKLEELKTFLAREKGNVETKGNSFAMISPGGITVDILPFGSIEIDQELNMADGEAQVVTNGFKEVFFAAWNYSNPKTGSCASRSLPCPASCSAISCSDSNVRQSILHSLWLGYPQELESVT